MKNDEKRRDSAAASAAPEDGGTVLATVSALMEERRRFESWIAALEARRSATPEHVFARVHADYSTRLNTVIGQLTTHADGLRRELETLTKRLEVLRDERQRAKDERAESELRAHVGELSAEDWATTAAASDASLADIGQRHAVVEHELGRTRDLLDDAERPTPSSPAMEVVPEPEPAPAPVAELAPLPPPARASAPAAPRPSAAVPAPADVPEPRRSAAAAVAQRNSVGTTSDVAAAAMHVPSARASTQTKAMPEQVSPQAAEPAPAPAAEPAAAPPTAAQQSLDIVEHVMPVASRATPHPSPNAIPSRNSSFDELAFLNSVVDTPSRSIEPPPPADMPDEKTRRDTFARRSQEDAIVNLTESGEVPIVPPPELDYEREPDSVLSRPAPGSGRESSGVDGTKSLKCNECSAMNYPTEWYCERCGAELASL